MSAQGLNSTAYNQMYLTGSSPGFPVRDASDYTRRLKQIRIFEEYALKAKTTGSITPYNNLFIVPVDYRIVQSNENRLTYNFGIIPCIATTTSSSASFPNIPLGTTR